MKPILKKFIGFVAGSNVAFDLLRFINPEKLLIMYYHRVVKKEKLANNLKDINMYTDIDKFHNQMKFLKERHRIVSEKEVATFMEKGRIPDCSVWITFDDGYKDNYTNAFPILKKYSIPATIFVTTGYINEPTSSENRNNLFMNWDEIIEMSKAGIFIGAHTVSHRILADLSDDEMMREIHESKDEIEEKIDRRVISFAYPVGKRQHYCLEKCIPILRENNIKLAVTTIGGFNTIKPKKCFFELNRMGVSYEDSLNFFKFKVSLGSFWQR